MNAPNEIIDDLEKSLNHIEEIYKTTVIKLGHLKNELSQQVEQDDLTHLLRRGSFMNKLKDMLQNAQQQNETVHVMMLDLDHFKKVNDIYGHQTGDDVLERVSLLIKNYLRPKDLAGRYGGEEVIIAVECTESVALEIAERIRKALEVMVFKARSNWKPAFSITMSSGLTSTKECGYEAQTLIERADQNLYTAKNRGRNQVVSDVA